MFHSGGDKLKPKPSGRSLNMPQGMPATLTVPVPFARATVSRGRPKGEGVKFRKNVADPATVSGTPPPAF